MIVVVVLSITAFILALAGNNWKWSDLKADYSKLEQIPGFGAGYSCSRVDLGYSLKFSHSIIGIVTLSLAVIQVKFLISVFLDSFA